MAVQKKGKSGCTEAMKKWLNRSQEKMAEQKPGKMAEQKRGNNG